MLTIYENRSGSLKRQKGKPRLTEAAVWVDLLNPTPAEEGQIERALKFDVPTREEQQEIEVSSRLYQEDGAYFMTATLMYQPEEGEPRMTPVTFILSGQRLITVRYAESRAFALYVARCNRAETDLKSERQDGGGNRPSAKRCAVHRQYEERRKGHGSKN